MPFVSLEGKRIHYVVGGGLLPSRMVLLFVHGAGGSHRTWLLQLQSFSKHCHALALDLPGHGMSEGEGASSVEEYRDFLKTFLEALHIETATLIGHSMGGAIVQSFALAYPGLLKAVVLVGTGAKLRVHPKILGALKQDPQEAASLLAPWAYAKSAPAELVEQGKADLLRCPLRVAERDYLACNAFDMMDRVKDISAPTLIISGTEDVLTPVKYAEYLHDHISGSMLVLIPGAGHMVMLEQPEAFNQALDSFLARLFT